jgi:hypothetical protein
MTRRIRGITAMVAFMGGIISQDCWPDVSDPLVAGTLERRGMCIEATVT